MKTFVKIFSALREHEYLIRCVHALFHGIGTGIGADILRAVILLLQHGRNRFKFFPCHTDVAVPFIVFEQDVVLGHVLLDKAALQHQCFKFAVGDNIVKILHVFNHFANLDRMRFRRAEILADAVFQSLCFTDINDLARRVFHNIHARQKRQAHSFCAQLCSSVFRFAHRLSHNNKNRHTVEPACLKKALM